MSDLRLCYSGYYSMNSVVETVPITLVPCRKKPKPKLNTKDTKRFFIQLENFFKYFNHLEIIVN